MTVDHAAGRRRRTLEEHELRAGEAPRPHAPPAVAAVLALQGAAGNQAVARMLSAAPRSVARSSTADDIEQQQSDDEADVAALLSSIAMPVPSQVAQEQTQGNVNDVPMTNAPSGPQAQPQQSTIVFDESGLQLVDDDLEDELPELETPESDAETFAGSDLEEPEMEVTVAPPRAKTGKWKPEHEKRKPYSRPGRTQLNPKMQAPAGAAAKQTNKVWNAGNFAAEQLIKGTQGAATPTNRDINASGVGQYAKAKKWTQRGGGTNTVQRIRPPAWPVFRVLLGYLGKASPCPYVMGHLLHRDFGGTGREMYNLSPFSHSLNGNHYNSIEDVLLTYTAAAPANTAHAVDYKVIANYGGSATIANEVAVRFNQIVDTNMAVLLAAFASAGVQAAVPATALTLPDRQAIAAAPGNYGSGAVIALPSGTQWQAVLGAVRVWLQTYVAAHFPGSIDCTARFYSRAIPLAGPPGPWDKWPRQDENVVQ